MSPFPNKIIYSLSFLAIIIYVIIDFSLKGHREFPQLNYDWDKTELVKDHGRCELISFAHNKVDLRLKDGLKELNNNNTLKIKTNKGKVFYFRYEYKMVKGDSIMLRGGVWLTQHPKNIDESNILVSEIKTPIVQNGNINVCFIGLTDNKWGGFRSLRRDLKLKYQSINFTGPTQDIYGYPYVPAKINKDGGFLASDFDPFPKADIYIVFFETLDISKDRVVWDHFIEGISIKSQLILLNSWPELKGIDKNEEIQNMNLLLHEIAIDNDKVKIIELNGQGAGATLLDNGQYFMDNKGYQLYKKEILENINIEK